MNDDLKRRCENSFYSELYHFDETSQDLVLDKTTGRVMLRKVLEIYEITVFKWLQENSNIHIPVIYSFYEENDKLTVLEEYIQGDTLDDYLMSPEDMADQIGWRILREVSLGLLSFLAITMYNDILYNEERTKKNPVIRAKCSYIMYFSVLNIIYPNT